MKWYKRDPKDAREGMRTLTLEERGAYNTLLDLIYETDNNVHDDDRYLAGVMGCDLRIWKRIRTRLLEMGKIQLEGGYIRNVRATNTLSQAVATADVNATNGRKSGAKRRKTNDLEERTAEQKPKHIDIDKEIDKGETPLPPSDAKPIPGPGAIRAEADSRRAMAARWPEFRETYPKREGGQSWPSAQKKYVAYVASGIGEEVIIAGARRYADHLRATHKFGTQYVKQAHTWLNQRGWEDEYLAGTGTGRRPGSDLMDAFDNRIREAEDRAGHHPPGEGNGDWPGTIDATFTEI